MKPNRRDFLTLGVGALAVATLPRALRRKDRLVRRTVPLMGTYAEIAVRHRDEAWAQRGIDAALAELRRVDRTMSSFKADSDVGRLNALAGREPAAVSEDCAEVLVAALGWAEASDGRFDPCLGKLVDLWHVETRTAPPTDAEVTAAGRGSHFRSLEVDRGGSIPRAVLAERNVAVDLGGIAVGYAVDLATRSLREQGIFNAIVNVGGDLAAMGTDADDEPWSVGVRSPEHVSEMVTTLRVSDRAVTTSGDYFKYFQYGGRRYHHLLDPVTGEPRRTSMHSLTIEAPTCIDADAGATALYGLDRPTADRILAARAPGARVAHSV
jgi:thiamine biosynthesis lipoprotein